MKNSEQQSAINNFIIFLAKASYSPEQIEKEAREKICDVYSNESFRHFYSRIFATIKSDIIEKEGNIDFLTENIKTLYELNNSGKVCWNIDITVDVKIKNKFDKLYDHVMLEISRINYYDQWSSQYRDIETKMKNANLEVVEANRQLSIANIKMAEMQRVIDSTIKQISDLQRNIESTKSEHITILSIFAAIMLASLGGLSLLSSSLQSVDRASIFKLIMICSITGFVLFNTTFMLIYMSARITGRTIYTFCPTAKDGTDCVFNKNKCQNDCSAVNRLKKRLPYVFWVNFVLLFLVLFDVIIYFTIKYEWIDGVCKLVFSFSSIIGLWIIVVTSLILAIRLAKYISRKFMK